jgi:antitoxin component HigA of HigAB toxin-antitoxin module
MDSSTTRTDLVICKYISQAMEANGITQADLSKALEGRSKGYVSDRVLGKRSWAISELDRLAPLFGLPDALSLVAAACGSISSEAARAYEARERQKITDDLVDRIAAHPEDYDVAANRDPNKEIEMNGGEGR